MRYLWLCIFSFHLNNSDYFIMWSGVVHFPSSSIIVSYWSRLKLKFIFLAYNCKHTQPEQNKIRQIKIPGIWSPYSLFIPEWSGSLIILCSTDTSKDLFKSHWHVWVIFFTFLDKWFWGRTFQTNVWVRLPSLCFCLCLHFLCFIISFI